MHKTTRLLFVSHFTTFQWASWMKKIPTFTNSIRIELRVYMHCDACEILVRRTIKKIEGIGTVEVDRDENKVTVTGDLDSKLLKRIEKKTGKKAEILIPEENEEEYQEYDVYVPYGDPVPDQATVVGHEFQRPVRWDLRYFDLKTQKHVG